MRTEPLFVGIFEGHYDPAVAIVRGGRVIAYAEEERFNRVKHAPRMYPEKALRYCLKEADATIDQVAAVATNWDLQAYTDGTMEAFFGRLNAEFPVDDRTKAWQRGLLSKFNRENLACRHQFHWRRLFGDVAFPPLVGIPHHYTHALQASLQSPFDRSICLTIDGSGDQYCTAVWKHDGQALTPLKQIEMPHSLGWFYAAITEYLGFHAYNCEYKVMGLAAYGRANPTLLEKMARIVFPDADGVGYRLEPKFIHYGAHTYSDRFTDHLVELFGRRPRLEQEPLTDWHEDLAFAAQKTLEETVIRLVRWAIKETGIRDVSVGGGVGLNVKMNSRLLHEPEVAGVFAHPLCSDGGAAQGAALAACLQQTGAPPERLHTLALGPQEANEEIRELLEMAGLAFEQPADICAAVAEHLARGRIVGWFQGRMEAGPRALGQRSILADPRTVENRDKVNGIIKFREYWRPFCPSMIAEAAPRYFDNYSDGRFMIMAFEANERLKREAPAIVHVDGTSRVQLVHEGVLPKYHRLIKCFEQLTGVPVVMNTSFNVKGEPVICSAKDALRTFWSTGLEILAIGDFLVVKPNLAAQIHSERSAA